MKDVSTLKDLMLFHLLSLYHAETGWSDSLKENASAVSDKELRKIFEKGSKTASDHAAKLKKMIDAAGKSTLSARNVVAGDLAREIREWRNIAADPEVLDAAMIVTHQCMNHYMIAKYGTLVSYARLLLEENMANELHQIMEEEKLEDIELTKLAEGKINVKAKAALIH